MNSDEGPPRDDGGGAVRLAPRHEFRATSVDTVWKALLLRLIDANVTNRTADSISFEKVYDASPTLQTVFGLSYATARQVTRRVGRTIVTEGAEQSVQALGCTIRFRITLTYSEVEGGAVECVGDLRVDLSSLAPAVAFVARPILETFMERRFCEERGAEQDAIDQLGELSPSPPR